MTTTPPERRPPAEVDETLLAHYAQHDLLTAAQVASIFQNSSAWVHKYYRPGKVFIGPRQPRWSRLAVIADIKARQEERAALVAGASA